MGLLEMYGGVPFLLILLCGILTAAGRILTDAERDMHNFLVCVTEIPNNGENTVLTLPETCELYLQKVMEASNDKQKDKVTWRPWPNEYGH